MITSSYKNFRSDKYTTYSISGDKGKSANYKGEYIRELAPKLSFFKVWHKNIGVISEEENNKYYIEQYYKQVLSKLDPYDIYKYYGDSVFLCYEDNMEFCHRHIVAAWLELLLDIKVREVKANDYDLEEVEKPDYIKKYLEEIMKKNLNMRGFNSLRALYLFKKGDQLEEESKRLRDIYGDSAYYIDEHTGQKVSAYERLMQRACFLRCDADEAEDRYNKEKSLNLTNNQ